MSVSVMVFEKDALSPTLISSYDLPSSYSMCVSLFV
jgi:hypothetical protein